MNGLKIFGIRLLIYLVGVGFIALGIRFVHTQVFGLICAVIGLIFFSIGKRYKRSVY